MPQFDFLGIAVLLIAFGLVIFLAVRLMLNAIPRLRAPISPGGVIDGKKLLTDHGEGVLIVDVGGRIKSINPRARQIFHLQEGETPNLERLARKVRPSEGLICLCASEGQTRFILDGRLVEGSSYLVNANHETTAVVSLRYPEISGGLVSEQGGISTQTLQIFTELTQAMAANLDLLKTIQAIFENIEKILAADFMEITIWDAESEGFIPYRYTGFPGMELKLSLPEERYKSDQGIGAIVFQLRQPLLVPDLEARQDLTSAVAMLEIPLRSFICVPLVVNEETIAVLSLGSMTPDTFSEDDLNLVKLLSGQAAIALYNALLYRTEKQRAAELSGLAQLAHAFGSVHNPAALFARLVESIAPLIPVDILGFLVYSEAQRMLEAQTPFHGLPDQIVQLYRAEIPAGSDAEKILLDQDVLLTENASEDEKWASLGLGYIAQAASLRETVLVPLSTGGHMQGYLQASNHSSASVPFTQAELHLLMIVANQTASIIENITLVHQSHQRALRAEALRRITSLASSAASLDEILQFSLQELSQLLHADIGAAFLLNQESGELRLHQLSIYGSAPQLPDHFTCLAADNPQFPFSITGGQRILSVKNFSAGEQAIIPFYQAVLDAWKIESLIGVPLVIRDEGIGEIWFGCQQASIFDQGDVQVVVTAAGQLAGLVEQAYLRSQTDESLRHRVDQLVAMSRISREMSSSLDPHYLLNMVYDETLRITHADCGTILLFDQVEGNGSKNVRFFVGDEPEIPFSALERRVIDSKAPVAVGDFSNSEYKQSHPDIQSALVVPILYQSRLAGLIALHGKQTNLFDSTVLEITQALAFQAAVALNNALAFQEQTRLDEKRKRELETLSRLLQVSRNLRPNKSLVQSLQEIAQAVQAVTPFQVVLISLYDPASQMLQRTASAGIPPELWEELRQNTPSWQSVQELLHPEYKKGNAFHLPAEKLPQMPEDLHIVNILPEVEDLSDTDRWRPHDILLFPLFDNLHNPLGLISLDAPLDNLRPDALMLDVLETFAVQISTLLENEQRMGRLERQVTGLVQDKERLENADRQSSRNLPMLLHKNLDQAIALRGLNQRIERVRATLAIAALANRQATEAEVIRTVASEMITRFAMQYALIAQKDSSGIRLVEVVGSYPSNVNPEALFGQRNPLRQLLQEKSRSSEEGILFISNLDQNHEWQNNNLLAALATRSLIGMQLDMGGERLAGVLVIGQRILPNLLDEDRQVFAQLAYQVSVGLQNLELLNETRRRLREVDLLLNFSRKLGSLKPSDILSSLIDNVIQVLSQANSGWVGMWDDKELAIIPQAATGYASNRDILEVRYALLAKSGDILDTRVVLPLRVFRTGQPERVGEVNFAEQYHLSSDDLLRYRRATNGRLPISVMLVPLQVGENVLGVLFLENFETMDAFSEEDEALASSFSRQATMALENARLYQASERRALQLQALTMVAGTITSSLQSDELISSLLDQLKLVLPYDTATLWLRSGDMLMVAAVTGFSDNELRLNLSVAVKDSALYNLMVKTSEPISVGDLRNDPRFPMLVEPDYLSWLGIPLIYKSEMVGLIALEKREADFYTPDFIQAGTTFASQAAVSLENARLYAESISRAAELDERSQRLALLNRLSSDLVASLDIDYIAKMTGQQLLDALDASGVAAVMNDPTGRFIIQVELPSRDDTVPLSLPLSPLFDHLQETQGIFQTDHVAAESSLRPLWDTFLRAREARSLLVVPLVSGSEIQGWFLIFRREEYRYTLPEIELARTMCNQSAIAIQNARLFAETRRLTADLERRVEERTKELRREHQNSQTLLYIITELSTSLDMDLVLNRTLNVLNESLGSEEGLIILSQNSTNHYRSGIKLARLSEKSSSGPALEHQIARFVVRTRQPVLVSRIQEDERWDIAPNATIPYQSVLAVPLVMGEDILGSLLLFHRKADFFSQDRVSLLEATARQIGIALNNAHLFNVIRDQSEHLGVMLREQQIEASRSRAILEAVADGVLVTDSQNRVNLLNNSAEKILNLKASQAMGKPLDHFSGLFGKSISEWMQTIRAWSKDPFAPQKVETFSEQLELDSGRIIAVHLAPVIWSREFLGTVSIFRDITHEVQVDRLKSEFVANVSHELRTPMTSIKGYVDLMLLGATGKISEQQDRFLNTVKSNTERLSGLVDDLLDISRIEAGHTAFRLQPIDMREIAEEVLSEIRRRAQTEKKPMTFQLEPQTNLPYALGDHERVRQVLSALVTNGYTYTPQGGSVKVTIHEVEKEIQVDVSDNGIGIAPEASQRIFERFYRGDDPLVLASAGTGLGLAIARALVSMHSGRIWFESSGVSGQGSTFSFTLPIFESQETQETQEKHELRDREV